MRLTRKNASGSYRIPGNMIGTFRIEYQQEQSTIFGDIANTLGRYEDIGTAEEFRELKKRYGTKK